MKYDVDDLRPIADAVPGYLVAIDGRVFSLRGRGERRGKMCELVPTINGRGYYHVSLRDATTGKERTRLVHHLVLNAFEGPRPSEEHEGRHLDGDRANNAASNLKWGTKAENEQDKVLHGSVLKGEDQALSKLTEQDVRDIRQKAADGVRLRALAKEYGVCDQQVGRIVSGKLWSHVPMGGRASIRRGNYKLDEDGVREIRRRNADGESYSALARELGMNKNTVRLICLRETWKEVE